jgi:hypothetical protein
MTLPNIHPGEVLLEEFRWPMGISQNALAGALPNSAAEALGLGPRPPWDSIELSLNDDISTAQPATSKRQ